MIRALEIRGVRELLKRNEKFQRQLTRTVSRSLSRSLRKTASATRRGLRAVSIARGITRSAWGKRKENRLTARVKPIRLRLGAAGAEVALGLYGFAAVLERGGRLVPHAIRARGRSFRHPGAAAPGYHTGAANLRRDRGEILQRVDADVKKLLEDVYGL